MALVFYIIFALTAPYITVKAFQENKEVRVAKIEATIDNPYLTTKQKKRAYKVEKKQERKDSRADKRNDKKAMKYQESKTNKR